LADHLNQRHSDEQSEEESLYSLSYPQSSDQQRESLTRARPRIPHFSPTLTDHLSERHSDEQSEEESLYFLSRPQSSDWQRDRLFLASLHRRQPQPTHPPVGHR
jgi:hypothetical protein